MRGLGGKGSGSIGILFYYFIEVSSWIGFSFSFWGSGNKGFFVYGWMTGK